MPPPTLGSNFLQLVLFSFLPSFLSFSLFPIYVYTRTHGWIYDTYTTAYVWRSDNGALAFHLFMTGSLLSLTLHDPG